MAAVLEQVSQTLRGRLEELEPLMEEHRMLTAAAAALDGVLPKSNGHVVTRKPAEPRTPRVRPASGARRGRRAGSGKRAAEAVELVRANPGIGIPDLAPLMQIKPNYLYRVLPGLVKAGKLVKEGTGYKVVETADE